jgi:hypothetical protein
MLFKVVALELSVVNANKAKFDGNWDKKYGEICEYDFSS